MNELTETECIALFDQLFPHGVAGDDVMAEVAPQGWLASPFIFCFHPTAEQLARERAEMEARLEELRKLSKNRQKDAKVSDNQPNQIESSTSSKSTSELTEKPRPDATPTSADATNSADTPTSKPVPASVEPQRELRELVGRCLWDIFSDNHEVIAADGRLVDLGSFRGSAGFIADYFNREIGQSRYDYMDFFMGTSWWAQRADPTPVYAMIFRRLRNADCDWRYVFPRLSLVNLQPLRDALDAAKQPDWQDYDPSVEMEREQQRQEQESQQKEMQQSLDAINRELQDTLRTGPAPATVIAYQNVFDRLPVGWPS